MMFGCSGCNTNKVNENPKNNEVEQENNNIEKQAEQDNTEVKIDEALPSFEAESTQTVINDVCEKIEFNKTIDFDVNLDGEKEVISIDAPEVTDGDYRTISISINDTTTEIVEAESYGDAYLLQNEQGNIGLLFDVWWSNDVSKTYLCKIDRDRKIIGIEEIEGNMAENSVTTSTLTIENYINLFGSWYGTCEYEITSDLQLSIKENFKIKNEDERYITSIKELVLEVKEGETWTAKPLKENKKFYPIATDNVEYMYFITEEEEEVRIKFTRVDYQVYVNDVAIEELFAGIEIAG
ncbi:hypothetical protein acsn021_02550 [Anaerocolumna cellulosilytica]|uniref:Uncharacterized protein n=2 Tax=Anaerocolumna cellulosilytica TaxID=433286 RepID=A0A6S6QSS4_9FIRM|nr:hypothetical protein acsn021_02550 [Anaerocolumna cellulosilytica]